MDCLPGFHNDSCRCVRGFRNTNLYPPIVWQDSLVVAIIYLRRKFAGLALFYPNVPSSI